MKPLTALLTLAALMFSLSAAFPDPAEAASKKFYNPKVGGKRLDGCYKFPGKCQVRKQANAFCKMMGYAYASTFDASNEAGLFQTKRLGDGGSCTASCTVMNFVDCYTANPEDDNEVD